MTSVDIASHLINHIVKRGRDCLHDTYINQEKVPQYSNTQSASDCNQIVIHGGYKAEPLQRFSYFRFKKDSAPLTTVQDSFAVKATKKITNPKVYLKESPKNASKRNKHYFKSNTKSSANSIKSIGFNTLLKFGQQNQATLIKLQQPQQSSQLATRVKNKQEQVQNYLRTKKQVMLQSKKKQMKQNSEFQEERRKRSASKKKILNDHVGKGQGYKFNFDNEGDIFLYCTEDKKINKKYPRQTPYKLQNFENEENQKPEVKSNQLHRYQSHHQNQAKKNINNTAAYGDHQRIQSARGLAFASSVLKTMNLSKISLNRTYQQFQPEHFMKRNDLFNNNHTRQTSNIPYFEAKSGTFYTEISTNQVVGIKPTSATTKTCQRFQSQHQERTFNKLSKKFESFLNSGEKVSCKTSRQEQGLKQMQERPVKTADHSGRKAVMTQRRPHSSIHNKGRIITANENLIVDLLQ